MNLNKLHKKAIVAAVVADIPRKHGKEDVRVAIQKIMDANIIQLAPEAVAGAYKNLEARNFLLIHTTNPGYLRPSKDIGHIHGLSSIRYLGKIFGDDKEVSSVQSSINEICSAFIEENEKIDEAESNLRGAIEGIRTRARFVEMFPELEKYGPAASEKTYGVPALANVVSGLVKLGWPKNVTAAQ